MTFLYQPFRFGSPGGAAVTGDADRHLRDKIIAVLFTAPGERVNNPRFGVGLNRTLFEGLDDLTAAALEFRVTQGLRRDIGDELIINGVDIVAEPHAGRIVLSISFQRRADRVPRRMEVEL